MAAAGQLSAEYPDHEVEGLLTEHVSLRERSENGDLISEDLARRPRDTGSSGVDTVDNQLFRTSVLASLLLDGTYYITFPPLRT